MIINREDTERRKSESYNYINYAKLAAEILMSFQQFFSGKVSLCAMILIFGLSGKSRPHEPIPLKLIKNILK